MFYDRYSWMTHGYQKYGTQSVWVDDNEYWVTIDPATTDAERARFNVRPLAELLREKPMEPGPLFQIGVDPRIELVSIVLHLSEWDYFGKFETEGYRYAEEVERHFGRFRDHPAVTWFNVEGENWNLDDPVSAMLWLSPPPAMTINRPLPLHPTCQISEDQFRQTVELLNRFAEESDFNGFWESHQDFYRSFTATTRSQLPFEDHLRLMMSFFGESKSRFVFILAPMINGASFGPQLVDGDIRIPHFISGGTKLEEGEPAFSDSYLRMLVFHEFGHSFVNPICEDHREDLFNHEHLFEYMREDMSAIAYPDWFPTCHEHMVRAAEGLLLEQAGYAEEARANVKKNLDLGFVMLPHFRQALESYLQNREEYPSLRSYFPQMLKVFDRVEAELE
jgi:hypothetical protein